MIIFKRINIFELNSIVCKDHREKTLKQRSSKQSCQGIEYIYHTLLCTIRHKEYEHEAAFAEDHGQKYFAFTPSTFDSVHLNYRKLRMCFDEAFKILISTTHSVLVFKSCSDLLFTAFTVGDLLRKIQISDREST